MYDSPIAKSVLVSEKSGMTTNGGDKLERRSSSRLAAVAFPRSPFEERELNATFAGLDLGPEWTHPVLYPRSPPSCVTVEYQDLARLDDGEFLNDNLVEFALRFMKGAHAELDKSVYMFNTYFYASLTGNGRHGIQYDSVKRWTNKVDLFSYDYVVVPINESLHWYLAIICNLGHLQKNIDLSLGEALRGAAPSPDPSAYSTGMLESSGSVMKKKSMGRGRHSATQPAIITLDSLGTPHSSVVGLLNQYLAAEAMDKRGAKVERLPGVTAKGIPEQDNHFDCGVMALCYVKQFLQNPADFVGKILLRESWSSEEWPKCEPRRMRRQILEDLQHEYRAQTELEGQKTEKLKQKRFGAEERGSKVGGARTRLEPGAQKAGEEGSKLMSGTGADGSMAVMARGSAPGVIEAQRQALPNVPVDSTRISGRMVSDDCVSRLATLDEVERALRPTTSAALMRLGEAEMEESQLE